MPAETASYEAVLADLMAKRDELDKAIAIIQRLMGVSIVADPAKTVVEGGLNNAAPEPAEIVSDTFFNMNISDAIKKYLRMSKRPKGVNTISDALQAGGMQTLSKNFYSSVYSALVREQDQEGGFKKVSKKEWGLAEWYERSKA